MAQSLASVNVAIGVDGRLVQAGVDNAINSIQRFRQRIGAIRLEGAIKGDPFSATRKTFDTMQTTLNRVFNQWTNNVQNVDQVMKRFARKSDEAYSEIRRSAEANVEAIMEKWNELNPRYKAVINALRRTQMAGEKSGFTGLERIAGQQWELASAVGGGAGTAGMVNIPQMVENLEKSFGGIGPKTQAQLKKLREIMNSETTTLNKDMARQLNTLEETVRKEGGDVVRAYQEMVKDFRTAQRQETRFDFKGQMAAARDTTAAIKRKNMAIKEALILEAKYRTEMNLGIDVRRNRIALMESMQRRLELNGNLMRTERRELQQLRNIYEKTGEAQDNLFSPAWFKQRARWFIQLRAFWAIWRGIVDTLRDLIELEEQLARAMRTARSEVLSTTEIAEKYTHAMAAAARQHGVGWKEGGEALYQLTSAGLSSEEALAALNDTMALVVGTEGDVREVTKAVAGVYNNFSDTLGENLSLQQKYQKIANVMAITWRDHQIEINEYVDALRHASAMGKEAGLSFEHLSAILGVLHSHMIKSGRAGRGLQNVLMRMSARPTQFAEAFGLRGEVNLSQPLKFMKIVELLNKKLRTGTMTVGQMGRAFQRMGLRGSAPFIKIVKHFDEVQDALKKYTEQTEAHFDIEEARLNTVGKQWDVFKGQFRTLSAKILKPILADPFKDALKSANNYISRLNTMWDVHVALRDSFDEEGGVIPEQAMKVTTEGLEAMREKMHAYQRDIDMWQKRNDEAEKVFGKALAKTGQIYQRNEILVKQLTKDLAELKRKYDAIVAVQKGGVTTGAGGMVNVEGLGMMYGPKGMKASKAALATTQEMGDLFSGITDDVKELLTTEEMHGLTLVDQLSDEQKLAVMQKQKRDAQQAYISDFKKWAAELKKTGDVDVFRASLQGAQETITNIDKLIRQTDQLDAKVRRDTSKRTKNEAQVLAIERDSLEAQRDKLRLGDIENEEVAQLAALHDQIAENRIKEKRLLILSVMQARKLSEPEQELLLTQFKRFKLQVQQDNLKQKYNDRLKNEAEQRRDINALTQQHVDMLNRELMVAQQNGTSQLETYQTQLNIIDEQIAGQRKIVRISKENSDARKAALAAIYKLETQRLGVEFKINMLGDERFDAVAKEVQSMQREVELSNLLNQNDKERMQLNYKLQDAMANFTKKYGEDIAGNQEAERVLKALLDLYGRLYQLQDEKDKIAKRELDYTKDQTALIQDQKDIELDVNATALDRLKIERQLIQLEIGKLQARLWDKNLSDKERADIMQQLVILQATLNQNLQKQQELLHPIVGIYDNMARQLGDINTKIVELGTQFSMGIGQTIGSVMSDALGGFQEQQQEVINLQGELAQLEVDYKAALSEGNAERAAEIANEMARMRGEIDDLESPIHNLKEGFRSLFKDLVDQIRTAIIQWIAMKAVMAGIGLLGGGGMAPGYAMGMDFGYAKGGVANIKSFRKFARGGMTKGPSLALLGDNKSGQELVIPSENIKDNNVSGYMRDEKTPINIVNLFTEEDLVQSMSGTKGQKVIINTIGRDMKNKGPTYRSQNA